MSDMTCHNEDTSHVEFNIRPFLLLVSSASEHVVRSTLGYEEKSLELELTLNVEMLQREMFLPIVRERLVERGVLVPVVRALGEYES